MKNRPTDTYTKTEKKPNIRMKRQMTVGLYNLRKFKYNQRQSLDKIETRWLFFYSKQIIILRDRCHGYY